MNIIKKVIAWVTGIFRREPKPIVVTADIAGDFMRDWDQIMDKLKNEWNYMPSILPNDDDDLEQRVVELEKLMKDRNVRDIRSGPGPDHKR